jgi:hypothetical protein
MGDDWTEQNLFTQALSIGMAASTKSYLDVVDDFMQLVTGDPSAGSRIIANIANSVVPLGGARNDLGKLIQPYQLELKSGIIDSIKNRNRITQENDAPIKIDFLNGEPLRDWNIFERFYEVFVPIPLRNVAGPGREMLFNSGYNLNVIGFTGPNGEDLKELPKVLEAYHQEMGNLNVEAKLNELAEDPLMQNSINGMNEFRRNPDAPGMAGVTARDFPHFDRLNTIMKRAQMRAWARMKAMPEVQKILEDKKQERRMQNNAGKTDKLDPQQLLVPTR